MGEQKENCEERPTTAMRVMFIFLSVALGWSVVALIQMHWQSLQTNGFGSSSVVDIAAVAITILSLSRRWDMVTSKALCGFWPPSREGVWVNMSLTLDLLLIVAMLVKLILNFFG